MEWPSSFRLTRADDHVVIDVSTTGVVAQPAQPRGTFVLRANPGGGRITLRFPPQQLLEYASNAAGERATQCEPIFTDPSVVVLDLPVNTPIPATVDGILTAAATLPIIESESTIELPHLLRLRPDGGWDGLRHRVDAFGVDGRFELWSSTLVDRRDAVDGTGGRPLRFARHVQAQSGSGAENDCDQTWEASVRDENKLRHTLDRATAIALDQVTDTEPAVLRDLRVSSLGGWLDVRGEWPDNDGLQTFGHVSSMGRDEAQRRGATGRLFPFGFRGVLTSETLRRLDGDLELDERTAGLRTMATIRVTNPVVEMPAGARALPFVKLEVLTALSPPGDAIEPAQVTAHGLADRGIAVLHVAGVPYRFQMEATDHAGGTFLVSMPMLFVTDGTGRDAEGQPDGSTIPDDEVMPLWVDIGTALTDARTDGQEAAVAPPPNGSSNGGRAGAIPPPGATTMRLDRIRFAPPIALPEVPGVPSLSGPVMAGELHGVLPGVDQLAPGAATAVVSYADTYLRQAFSGANDAAGVFLSLAEQQVVGVGKEVTGGLAQLGLPVTALSRERGAVVGAVENLLAGKPDLSFLDDAPDLLGVIPMTQLIPIDDDLQRALEDAAEIGSEVIDGVVHKTMRWSAPLFDPRQANPEVGGDFFVVAPFKPTAADRDPSITIEQTVTLDAGGRQLSSRSRCEVVGFQLHLLGTAGGTPIVTVPFRSFTFSVAAGEKPDVDVLLGRLVFGGFLRYLGRLVDLIDDAGFNDPPALAVTDTGVTSSFTFPVPSIAIGMFALQNISFGAKLDIFFDGAAPTLVLNFSKASDRFRLTVAALGGGGFLELELDTGGVKRVTGSLEFGAAAALDVLVAVVSVEAMGGVTVTYDRETGLVVVAHLRVRGHVDVVSLISADIQLTLTLTYREQSNSLRGEGELVLQLKVLFVSESLRVPVSRQFAGQNADPSFAELMAPADFPGRRPWDDYCDAFAAEAVERPILVEARS